MRTGSRSKTVAVWMVAAAALGGCTASFEAEGDRAGKIPITTRSEAAREHFLRGRGLADRIRFAEARGHFEQAVAEDPDFALAHLMLATTATSALEFFDGLERAVELAETVSEGESLLILAQDAGSRGDLGTQRQHLTRLVELHPRDERARFALGGYHFGRQEFDLAIEQYLEATEIDPDYSPAYNLLGYAYRTAGRFDEAEAAFKRYIELIPDEPNPYDSYAEFLMKQGRFEESIANYRQALEIDREFVPSYVGIANNQILLGRGAEARDTLERLLEVARNDGERRQAHFWTAVSWLHEDELEAAEAACGEMLAIAEAAGDWAQVAGDLALIGDLRHQGGDGGGALEAYDEAVAAMERADVNLDVRDAFSRGRLYRQTRVAIVTADSDAVTRLIDAYADAVARRNIPNEVRRLHELQGLQALAEGEFAAAVEHLEQANQQDPRVLFELATAHRRAGNEDRARELARTAADWNQLDLNYAYVRSLARRFVEEVG